MVKIAHLADIHIQDRRRAEYSVIFQSLYSDLSSKEPDLIVVAGDIFDNKMRASAHNLEDVANFLTSLVKIAPTVIIAGNHDTNCLTPGELDLLTPLIGDHNMLQPPNLTYWRNSGVYHAHDMIWTVIATDGTQPSDEEEREFASKYDSDLPHICLFHEEVNGTSMPNGLAIGGFKLSPSSFSKYDLTMGGHIHLRQKIGSRGAYCGSLIQQNIGEHHKGHGYIMWELTPTPLLGMYEPYKTAPPVMTEIDIHNDVGGFVRIIVDRYGHDITEVPIPQTPLYWELIHTCELPPMHIVDEYTKKFKMQPRAVRPRYVAPLEGASASGANTRTNAAYDLSHAQMAAKTIESHEEIIRDILQNSDLADAVIAMHRENWKDVPIIVGGKFRLIRFEFDNMYAFGTSNAIDFSSLEGCVSGVIASNHTGKSSLIEALLFALYEDHPRAPSKKNVIHRGASNASMILEFELDGKMGKIEKAFTFGSHQQSQYKFYYNCEDRTRGGTTETLKEIESVLGGSINALASSFQLQGGESGGFIGGTPAARKKLLANVMSLGSFEGLEYVVTRDISATRGEIKSLDGQFHGVALETIDLELQRMRDEKCEIAASAESITGECEIARGVCVEASFRVGSATNALAAAKEAVIGYIRPSPQYNRSSADIELLKDKLESAKTKIAKLIKKNETFVPPIDDTPSEATIAQFKQAESNLLHSNDKMQIIQDRLLEVRAAIAATAAAADAATADAVAADTPDESLLRKNIQDVNGILATLATVAVAATTAATTTSAATTTTAGATLEKAQKSYDIKQKWLTASTHSTTIANHLHYNDDCVSCANTKKIFTRLTTGDAKSELVTAAKTYVELLKARLNEVITLRELRAKEAVLLGEINTVKEIIKCNEEQLNISRANMRGYTPESAQKAKIERHNLIAAAEDARKARELSIAKLQQFIANSEQEIVIAMNADHAALVYDNLDAAEKNLNDAICELKLATTTADLMNDNLNKLTAQISVIDQDILRTAIEREYEAERMERYVRANKQQVILKAYRTVLKPVGGIGDRLLEKGRNLLEQKINDALYELGAKFRISIAQDYDIAILNVAALNDTMTGIIASMGATAPMSMNVHDKSVPSTLASGYQKFVLSLAARLAIWRLSTSPRPDAFIIDEGFGACDEENLESMASALESLASAPGGPQLVFIVSHVDTLKTRLERFLEIEVLASGSKVSNTIQEHIVKRSVASNAQIASDVIGPDPEKIGNVYCQSCKQSLTIGRLSKHLTTQKHTESLKRLRKLQMDDAAAAAE